MNRDHKTFIGVDLGGARGKTTAVAELSRADGGASVSRVFARSPNGKPWTDDELLAYVAEHDADTVLAINAPLVSPSCVRCTIASCPGVAACEVPAVVWLRNQKVAQGVQVAEAGARMDTVPPTRRELPRTPYVHRGTEVHLHARGLLARDGLGRANSRIASRGVHLRRRLAAQGIQLDERLLEVSPRATVHALFGERHARGYKRDADPWETRASIVEGLSKDLSFAPTSAFSREDVLQNDHCFDALLAAYTAYLWARDGWQKPADVDALSEDGWIWAPPS